MPRNVGSRRGPRARRTVAAGVPAAWTTMLGSAMLGSAMASGPVRRRAPGCGCGAAAARRAALPARFWQPVGGRNAVQVDHGSADLDDDGGLGVPAWCTVTVVCWRPASFVVASMVCGRTNPSSSPHRTGRAGSAAPNDGDQPAMIIVGRRNITDAPGGSRGAAPTAGHHRCRADRARRPGPARLTERPRYAGRGAGVGRAHPVGFQKSARACDLRGSASQATGHDRWRATAPALLDLRPVPQLAVGRRRCPRCRR